MSHLRSRRDYGQEKWVTKDQMAEICPTCAEKMDEKGLNRVRESVLKKAMMEAGMSSQRVANLLRTARQPDVPVRSQASHTAARAALTDVGKKTVRKLTMFLNKLGGWESDQRNTQDALRSGQFRWTKYFEKEPEYEDFMDGWNNWMNERRRIQVMKKWGADNPQDIFKNMKKDFDARKGLTMVEAKKAAELAIKMGMPRNYVRFGFSNWTRGSGVVFAIELNNSLVRFSSHMAAWDKLPKGWTQDSVKKMWEGLTGRAPKHKVTACIKKMEGKVDDPGAFCASLARKVGRDASIKTASYKSASNHMAYRHYRNMRGDPRWMKSRYPGIAVDGTAFERGDEILYWPRMPRGKNVMVGEQAKAAWEQFQSEASDEEFMNPGGRYGTDSIVSELIDVAKSLV